MEALSSAEGLEARDRGLSLGEFLGVEGPQCLHGLGSRVVGMEVGQKLLDVGE